MLANAYEFYDDTLTFCLSEDRPEMEVGVRLLVASLKRHCAGTRSVLYYPTASPSLRQWLQRYPDVELKEQRPEGADRWNCKPHALLPLLRDGNPQVAWLDTDIILAGDPRPLLTQLDPEMFAAAQEPTCLPDQGSDYRVRSWGEPIGRSFPFTLNSCVLRATPQHIRLLERWEEGLQDPRYRDWFKIPEAERPPFARTDQDVLNVVLGGREFGQVPVFVLRSGVGVIHSGGALVYSPGERLRGLFAPRPPILHALAIKPWVLLDPSFDVSSRYWSYRQLMQEISPFVAAAREYRAEIEIPCPWLDLHTVPGRLIRMLGLGHWALRGLPVGILAWLVSRLRPGLVR